MQYYFNQLVEILLELRRQNIVHRDIKLESLYLDGDMGLKLGDFGESAECLMERRRSIIKLSHFSCPEIINQSGHAF
jgi:serine/threonine protein kinase